MKSKLRETDVCRFVHVKRERNVVYIFWEQTEFLYKENTDKEYNYINTNNFESENNKDYKM